MATHSESSSMSLSTKLLILTVVFVLIAELVVLIPSISNQRIKWFEDRLEAAYLVGLALEDSENDMIGEEDAMQLFSTANILGVTAEQSGIRTLILAPEIDPHGPDKISRVDLRKHAPLEMMTYAWGTMFSKGDEYIKVTGEPRFTSDGAVDIIVSQKVLREDLLRYARNILLLSLFISSLSAALVYWSLNRMIVHPVKRLTHNMVVFEADPEQEGHILKPSNRRDEIGAAEHSLAAMEQSIHDLLCERRRLAALGAGISKISHDLRNILASAQLMSDRLAKSEDPRVKKLSPRLISALDRAIVLSRDTLAFGRMEPGVLNKSPADLHALVEEVFDATATMGIKFNNACPEGLQITADRTHLYRSLFNLVRNAIDAMKPAPQPEDSAESLSDPDKTVGTVSIRVSETDSTITIDVADTGPGVPDHAREALFEPFKGSQKPGGSGLGLAISSEIARAHGGELALAKNDAKGAVFRMTLPQEKKAAIAA